MDLYSGGKYYKLYSLLHQKSVGKDRPREVLARDEIVELFITLAI